jgi:hypothetical protein
MLFSKATGHPAQQASKNGKFFYVKYVHVY